MATVRLSPWILGLAFLGLPRLAQAQNVTSGTAIYTTNWTGGTISSGATLRLDNGGTVSGNVTNNGTFQYNASGDLTINNTIAGTGTLTKDGAGTLTLSSTTSSFSGDVTINAGTLVAAGGIATTNVTTGALGNPQASRTININTGGTLQFTAHDVFGRGASTPVAALNVAGGTITNDGTHFNVLGPLTLTGGTMDTIGGSGSSFQSYHFAGSVTVTGGTTSTISGSGSFSGYHLGANTNFNVAASTTLLTSGVLINQTGDQSNAAGALTKSGTGTMVLSGANTYTGSTTISAGTLQIGNGSTTGSLSASSSITNNGTLAFNRGDTITQGTDFNSVISGTGAVTQAGSGTLVLNGVNTYSGGTTINAGTVTLGTLANQALGTGTVVINSGSTLVTDRITLANSLTLNGGTIRETNGFGSTYSGAIDLAATSTVTTIPTASVALLNTVSGAGGLIKNGTGTVTLSGANTYAGATTISTGTLQVSGASGALTATSAVNINGGTLLLSGSAANRISDAAPISLGAATDSKLQLSGAVTETLGALTLAGGAGARVIDFGATSGVLTFASLSAASSLPGQIWNWSGNVGIGGGTDRLFITSGAFGGSLAASDISFFSGPGTGLYTGATTFTSGGELVPVPEASTLLAVLGLIAPLAWRERRHWMRCREARG